MIIGLLVLIGVMVYLIFPYDKLAGHPAISEEQAKIIIDLIRTKIYYQNPVHEMLPAKAGIGMIVSLYTTGQLPLSAGAIGSPQRVIEDICTAILSRPAFQGFMDPMRVHITLHVIHEPVRIYSNWLLEHEIGYSHGLTGVILGNGDSASAFTGPMMFSRRIFPDSAEDRLKGFEAAILYGFERVGLFTFYDETYGEIDLDNHVSRIYRVNTLLQKPSPTQILDACRDAGDYLLRHQLDNGMFHYIYRPDQDKTSEKEYNLLRHAGTIYSMYQLFIATQDKRYLSGAENGYEWLSQRIKTEKDKNGRLIAYPKEKGDKVKLGGVGLVLIAACERAKAIGDTPKDKDLRQHLSQFILNLQKNDGGFMSYYVPEKEDSSYLGESIYYPGEAILGLIRAHKLDPHPEWVEACIRGVNYLDKKRWRLLDIELGVPPDAWLLLALRELYESKPKKEFVDLAMKIAKAMVDDQHVRFVPFRDYAGGFVSDPPRVTPAGSRQEGLTATYFLLQSVNIERRWLFDAIESAAAFQLSHQIQPRFAFFFSNPLMASGGFMESPTDAAIRIDYVQHNLSSLLAASEIIQRERP